MSFIKRRRLRKKLERDRIKRREALLRSISETVEEMHAAHMKFMHTSDPRLIEASVYEINAAQRRYGYYLNRAKAEGIENFGRYRFGCKQ